MTPHFVALVLALTALLVPTGCATAADVPAAPPPTPAAYWVYIGTFSQSGSKGIYLFKLDTAAGTLTPQGLAAEESDPNFLALHPNGNVLYAVASKPGNQGAVDAFTIDRATGKLALLNQQPTGGANAVYVSVDRAGKMAFVANYDGPSVAALPLNPDGSLAAAATDTHTGSSINPGRQKRAFPHSILTDPAGHFAFSPDLGCDKIFSNKLETSHGTMAANDPATFTVPAGFGPRHMAFHPTAPYAYILTEMAGKILTCSYDPARGTLQALDATSTLPADYRGGFTAAEIKVHPSGRFLYASTRGPNIVGAYDIDPATGKLTFLENQSTRGRTPRGFNLDPSGAFLIAANQDSNSIALFRIDSKTGLLTPTGPTLQAPCPVSVLFVPVSAN